MTHLDPRRTTTRRELRSFGLLVGGAFLTLAAFLWWRKGLSPLVGTFGSIGGGLAVAGAVIPQALSSVYAGWMRFAILLSRITTPVFMGVIYFVVLTPIGLLMRALGKNPLRPVARDSLWVNRPAQARASVLERQF
jgi:hypothetical protein